VSDFSDKSSLYFCKASVIHAIVVSVICRPIWITCS